MNIFESAREFVDLDNRKFRDFNICSARSLTNKLQVQLDPDLIKNKTILDLGSCLGAAGHWALHHGALHYTGVELQDYYADTSRKLLNKYWPTNVFDIIKTDIESFLDSCIKNNQKYDYVLIAGVLQVFFNTIDILKKIASVTKEILVIDAINLKETDPRWGFIQFKNISMVKADANVTDSYYGLTATINLTALDMIMSVNSFHRKENKLQPAHHGDGLDPYNDVVRLVDGTMGAQRYIVRYTRTDVSKTILQEMVLNDDTTSMINFKETLDSYFESAPEKKISKWAFDSAVADRFQQEAMYHIPDYRRVINLCVDIAKHELSKTDPIIDVGSALGYTLNILHHNGFTNITGVEQSKEMIAKGTHSDKVICSDKFPNKMFQLVLINWTLHFIEDKESYLKDVYNHLNDKGILIMTDKTIQSELIKNLYYQFKRNNGIDQTYIEHKEKQLAGYMHLKSVDWYINFLKTLFSSVEIINSNLGFVTFLCRK